MYTENECDVKYVKDKLTKILNVNKKQGKGKELAFRYSSHSDLVWIDPSKRRTFDMHPADLIDFLVEYYGSYIVVNKMLEHVLRDRAKAALCERDSRDLKDKNSQAIEYLLYMSDVEKNKDQDEEPVCGLIF